MLVPGCLALQILAGRLTQIRRGGRLASEAPSRSASAHLDGFRRNSLRDQGAKGFEVLQEIGHPNHFTLVEKWFDQKAYDEHNLAKHTRHFRDQLQPMLASPFDERIHTELNGS